MGEEKLIAHYENRLEKVKAIRRNDPLKERREAYIAFAQGELDAVKANGMDGLIAYWRNDKGVVGGSFG